MKKISKVEKAIKSLVKKRLMKQSKWTVTLTTGKT